MHVRCGYLIGKPTNDEQERFDEGLRALVQRMRALPGLEYARLLLSRLHEPAAPRIYATIELNYVSEEAMTAALRTPLRAAIRADFLELMTSFEGHLTHINSEVR